MTHYNLVTAALLVFTLLVILWLNITLRSELVKARVKQSIDLTKALTEIDDKLSRLDRRVCELEGRRI